jgi:ribosome biogenesis protein ENP2
MRATVLNDVRVYDLAAGKTLPEWLSEKRRRQLQKDEEFRRRIELIQDFHFPGAAHRIQMAGDHVVAAGSYPPQVRVYDTHELSLKFERRLDAEIVDFCVLEGWRKLAFLCADKHIEVHGSPGRVDRARIPEHGRALSLDAAAAEVLAVGSGRHVYRLNLEEGRFLAPWETGSAGLTGVSVSSGHGLAAVSGEDGSVEIWDGRSRTRAGRVECPGGVGGSVPELTCVEWDWSGLHVGAGTSDARCVLWDVRSSRPLHVKEHPNDTPVVRVRFHAGSGNVVSADKRAIRFWRLSSGEPSFTIEAPADLSDVCLVPRDAEVRRVVGEDDGLAATSALARASSGLLLAGGAQPKMMAWFVPELGPAPRWCSYLDSLTEEMEEKGADLDGKPLGEAFDDYKFITRDELKTLSLEHLLGSALLRPFLHGYFIDIRLYNKVRAVRAARDPALAPKPRRDKAAAAAAQRIVREDPRRGPAVNSKLAADLDRKRGRDDVLHDDRFAALFHDPAFQVDQQLARVVHVRPHDRDDLPDHPDHPELDADDADAGGAARGGGAGGDAKAVAKQGKKKPRRE